jgi:hypothetical protein
MAGLNGALGYTANRSGVRDANINERNTYNYQKIGYYDYTSTPSTLERVNVGTADQDKWETRGASAQTSVTDLGRSADERRIYLISKGMSDVPDYRTWSEDQKSRDFKYTNERTLGYSTVFNNDVYAYHEYLDNKFGADNFSKQRDGTIVTNAATSTDPAVQALRASATTRDTGGTQAVEATAAEPKRRGRRGATLAALDSSVDKPTILGG